MMFRAGCFIFALYGTVSGFAFKYFIEREINNTAGILIQLSCEQLTNLDINA